MVSCLRIWNLQRSLQVLHLPHSSQVDKAEQQAYALVFDDLSVKVLPESTSKLAGDLPIHFWIQSGFASLDQILHAAKISAAWPPSQS